MCALIASMCSSPCAGVKSFWRLCTMIGLPPGLTSSNALLMSCSLDEATGQSTVQAPARAAVRSLSFTGHGRNGPRPPLLRRAQPWRVRSFSSTPARVSRSV
ncbi:hypothetical protein G6F23_014782 [Rhizopus arrhizus]|nr:hypothetical protein G6F23_014782 [Rhizopus arrhizus]